MPDRSPHAVRSLLFEADIPRDTGERCWYWLAHQAVFSGECWTVEEHKAAVEEIRKWIGV